MPRMITPRQIRAARALLGWSQRDLVDKAIISPAALARLETGKADTRLSTLVAVQRALEAEGIEFQSVPEEWEAVRLVFRSSKRRIRDDP